MRGNLWYDGQGRVWQRWTFEGIDWASDLTRFVYDGSQLVQEHVFAAAEVESAWQYTYTDLTRDYLRHAAGLRQRERSGGQDTDYYMHLNQGVLEYKYERIAVSETTTRAERSSSLDRLTGGTFDDISHLAMSNSFIEMYGGQSGQSSEGFDALTQFGDRHYLTGLGRGLSQDWMESRRLLNGTTPQAATHEPMPSRAVRTLSQHAVLKEGGPRERGSPIGWEAGGGRGGSACSPAGERVPGWVNLGPADTGWRECVDSPQPPEEQEMELTFFYDWCCCAQWFEGGIPYHPYAEPFDLTLTESYTHKYDPVTEEWEPLPQPCYCELDMRCEVDITRVDYFPGPRCWWNPDCDLPECQTYIASREWWDLDCEIVGGYFWGFRANPNVHWCQWLCRQWATRVHNEMTALNRDGMCWEQVLPCEPCERFSGFGGGLSEGTGVSGGW